MQYIFSSRGQSGRGANHQSQSLIVRCSAIFCYRAEAQSLSFGKRSGRTCQIALKMAKTALITGGNGITGSAITEYLAHHTTKEEWSQIIVTSRSPFKTLVQDPRIIFVALDFTKDAKVLASLMKNSCASVTHVYFSSYVHKDDFVELNKANQALFENFMEALLETTPKLKNVTLQTGGKYYNVHLGPCEYLSETRSGLQC